MCETVNVNYDTLKSDYQKKKKDSVQMRRVGSLIRFVGERLITVPVVLVEVVVVAAGGSSDRAERLHAGNDTLNPPRE